MPDNKPEIEIEGDDLDTGAPEIEIIDDTPEEDRGKAPKGEVEVTDDEISQYSDNVQKRIKDLRRAYHDERREKDRFLREQQEALAYAQKVVEHNRMLQERLSQGEQVLVATSKERTEALLTQAERDYKEAYEAGDSDKMIAAQRKLSEVVFQKREVENYQPRYTPPLQEPQIPVQQQQQPQIVPDERTRQWVTQNEWFEKDAVMRGAAFGIHDQLVQSGYVAGSDAYFEQIDARIRDSFPQKFGAKKPAGNVVAPASRSVAGSKKITLTKTQVAIAKRLGVPLEKYAEQVAKEMNNV
jgi:hypothetical protein